MNTFPRRLNNIRDKSRDRIRSIPFTDKDKEREKERDREKKSRPLITETIKALFKNDDKDERRGEDKIQNVQERLDELGITDITTEHIKDILATKYADGNPARTAEFIEIEQKSSTGTIIPYDPRVEMVGAENHNHVTCYLDSLLFAMFAKMDAFESILKNDFADDKAKNHLVNLLRIWVNMLRSGKLIPADQMEGIQDALEACGWPDFDKDMQQDTSEAFTFITETLNLPLLSLQVDLFHGGKREESDKKVVHERLLYLSVPEESDGQVVKLEDCLEDYFNGTVNVFRDREDTKKEVDERTDCTASQFRDEAHSRLVSSTTSMSSSDCSGPPTPVSITNDQHQATITVQRIDPVRQGTWPEDKTSGSHSEKKIATRHRSASVIQSILIEESGRRTNMNDHASLHKGARPVKAVTIPAWQFFRLIPWLAMTTNGPENDEQVAKRFDQRPVVGICLKRYSTTGTGTNRAQRHNTYIDIPDSVRLPHFMLADDSSSDEEGETHALDSDYKLVLQSVICHRGDDINSGHYISFARVAPKLLTDNRRHDFDPPPDYEEAVWVRFDDLDLNRRVVYVDDIKEALKTEMPYLLFYQVVPMADSPDTEGTENADPPSYDEFETEPEVSRPSPIIQPLESISNQIEVQAGLRSSVASIVQGSQMVDRTNMRPSTESEKLRKSQEERISQSWTSSNFGDSRPQSMNLTGTPAITPETKESPAMIPVDESTASRLSRAAARAIMGRPSRAGSQTGENRISNAVRSLWGRSSKDQLMEPPVLSITTPGSVSVGGSGANSPLNITIAGSDGRRSSEVSRRSEISHTEVESPVAGSKRKKSKGKGKEKEKDKVEKKERVREKIRKEEKPLKSASTDDLSQPERECTVM